VFAPSLDYGWHLQLEELEECHGLRDPRAGRSWSAPFAATPLVWLTAVAAGAIVAGLAGLRGREIG